jgi:Calcineurin-like phosphoesterase
MPPPTTGPSIRWLHISDLHLREKIEWSQDIVLRSLLADIVRRYTGPTAADAIFITGDVAFSGKAEEYILAERFIRALQEATATPPERLFIIPGNHDVDRSLEEDALRGAQLALSNELEVDRFFANDARRRTLFRRQTAFRSFVNRVAPPVSPCSDTSFAHWKHAHIGPIRIAALLLDSAWLSEGGEADTGRLLIGERQVIDAHASGSGPAVMFGLAHHPFAWLKEFEQVPIENLLLDRANIILRGHVHAADIRAIEALERRITVFTAGATFETRTSANSYHFVTLDLLRAQGTAITHRYVHAQQRWEATEPQPWRPFDSAKPSVTLTDALSLFPADGHPYRHYKALLVAGHITDVPRRVGDRYALLSLHLELPADPNDFGHTISAVRNLVYWRSVWQPHNWEEQLSQLLASLHDTLDALAQISDLRVLLAERERHCEDTARALGGNTSGHRPTSIVEHLAHLFAAGDLAEALSFIERLRVAGATRTDELVSVTEMEILALIELHRVSEAMQKLTALLAASPDHPHWLYLASRTSYALKQHQPAATYMHRALDAGFEITRARHLALLIAGQAGDRSLADRVR